jgi:hypothetical protein
LAGCSGPSSASNTAQRVLQAATSEAAVETPPPAVGATLPALQANNRLKLLSES